MIIVCKSPKKVVSLHDIYVEHCRNIQIQLTSQYISDNH